MINGSQVENISPMDRGLAYGDGLFETIRVLNNQLILQEEHLNRLYAGMKRLGIVPDFDRDLLNQEMHNTIRQSDTENGVIKVIITRGKSGRGYSPISLGDVSGDVSNDVSVSPTRIVQFSKAPEFSADYYNEGIKAKILSTRMGLNPDLAGLKHLNRLEQVLGASELGDEFTEGVMLDVNGLAREGTRSNIFFVENQKLVTPDLRMSGVHGVMRSFIISQSEEIGLPCHLVDDCNAEQLFKAEEIFFCNSLFGVWPVKELTGEGITRQFKDQIVTRRIQELIVLKLRMEQG